MKSYSLLLVVILLSGCGLYDKYPSEDLDFSYNFPSEYSEQRDIVDNSIFSSNFAMNLYGNVRDYKVGDVVMIKVNETSIMDNSASNKVSRSFKSKLDVPNLLGFSPPSIQVNKNKRLNMEANLSNENALDGEFGHKHSQKIQLMITASVVAVLPGGKLFLQGEKEFYANDTAELIRIRGIGRLEDIMADNTILAERLADLKFQFSHKGKLSKGANQGWLGEFWSRYWPF